MLRLIVRNASKAVSKLCECSTPRAIGSLILANVSSGAGAVPPGAPLGASRGSLSATIVKRALCRGEHFFLFSWTGFVGGQTQCILGHQHGHFLHVICETVRVSEISGLTDASGRAFGGVLGRLAGEAPKRPPPFDGSKKWPRGGQIGHFRNRLRRGVRNPVFGGLGHALWLQGRRAFFWMLT